MTVDVPISAQLTTVSDFWNQAPISKPYLDCLDTESWPDAWSLIDNRILDANTVSLGMFYTLLFCEDRRWTADRLRLAMLRQPLLAWEGLVCLADDQWMIGYDRRGVTDLQSIPGLLCMHTYKYDLRKRCVIEIREYSTGSYHA